MDFDEYQRRALDTRQAPAMGGDRLVIPLLGLAGEVGELLSVYKKRLRDGEAHSGFTERVAEELGDLLWYLSDVSSHFGLKLSDIAAANIEKCTARWGHPLDPKSFDADYPEDERLPRRLDVDFTTPGPGKAVMRLFVGGQQVGDVLTDNAYADDGYRFHDVFHLSCMAALGWSPVMRKLLSCKRKSRPKIDEVEDGARARTTEEAISALVYSYARSHSLLQDIHTLDSWLLRVIKDITNNLEVRNRTVGQWEQTILMAYEVWRQLISNQGGRVVADLENQSIVYEGRSKGE